MERIDKSVKGQALGCMLNGKTGYGQGGALQVSLPRYCMPCSEFKAIFKQAPALASRPEFAEYTRPLNCWCVSGAI